MFVDYEDFALLFVSVSARFVRPKFHSFVRMSMIVLGVRARFMQPGELYHHPVGPIQLYPEEEKKRDSEQLYVLQFDSQRHSRMPQMESFLSCAGMSGMVQHQCKDGLAAPRNVSGNAFLEEGCRCRK